MEFLDEESRPRVLFQSRPSPSSTTEPETLKLNKPLLFISLSTSSLLFALSIFFLQSETLKFLLFWSALSLLLGPFAPAAVTGGDVRVGRGSVVEFPDQDQAIEIDESKKKVSNRRSKPPRRPEDLGFNSIPMRVGESVVNESAKSVVSDSVVEEEREWTEEDVELLKKQLLKHPIGKPRRWEVIAEVFQGRHGVESVIKEAKSPAEKKSSDADSFKRFLKDRKPMDKRLEEGDGDFGDGLVENGGDSKRESWSGGEDIALLNGLKAFPKDVPMRWEKIAAAVPGKSKAACVKRVSELKKDFRSSKTSAHA